MGFYYTHCKLPGEQLSLSVVRDKFSTAFLRFISFLKARGSSGDYLCKNCHSILRILHFLRASSPAPYSPTKQQQFKEQEEMLEMLKWQLRKISRHRPFNYDAMMDAANWKDVHELFAFIEQEKLKACTLVQVRRPSHASSSTAPMWVACGAVGGGAGVSACPALCFWLAGQPP